MPVGGFLTSPAPHLPPSNCPRYIFKWNTTTLLYLPHFPSNQPLCNLPAPFSLPSPGGIIFFVSSLLTLLEGHCFFYTHIFSLSLCCVFCLRQEGWMEGWRMERVVLAAATTDIGFYTSFCAFACATPKRRHVSSRYDTHILPCSYQTSRWCVLGGGPWQMKKQFPYLDIRCPMPRMTLDDAAF